MTESEALDAMTQRRLASGKRYNGALWPSPRAHAESARRAILGAGLIPVRATYDDGGNCTVCGEAGRCVGYHAAPLP